MKVLIAVDKSDFSRIAVEHCLNSQWSGSTELRVISVMDYYEPLVALEQERDRHIAEIKSLVNGYVERIHSVFPELAVSGDVLDGYCKTKILEDASNWGADLIVLGSRGMSGFKRMLLGSISQAVLNSAPCPVRIVRSADKLAGSRVVIAQDSSAHSRAALKRLIRYPWKEKTRFTIVYAIPDVRAGVLEEPSEAFIEKVRAHNASARAEAEKIVESARDFLKGVGSEHEVDFEINLGDAREEILTVAENKGARLIVLGSHSRDAIDRMMLGSVSEGVAINAPCSVEVVRGASG